MISLESQDSVLEHSQKSAEVQLQRRQTPVWLDLGCGVVKQPPFIGLDRYPLPGVDVIADLDRPLPFRDDSVDLVFASHSLEHVNDLVPVMKEIYRVCRHGAQVCVVAPYYQQALNLANPYHKQVFNEHTPRFWTNAPTAPIATEEFIHPHAAMWGLSESDSRISDLDLRCVRMEFFYFPQYRYLPPEEQRQARQQYLDVCDQIMFHLLVVKTSMDEAEMQHATAHMAYYEPPFVQIRRFHEERERYGEQVRALQEAVAEREEALTNLRTTVADLQTTLASIQEELRQVSQEKQANERAQATVVCELQTQLLSSQQTTQELHQTLATREDDLAHVTDLHQQTTQELQQTAQDLQHALSTHESNLAQIGALHTQLARFEQHKQSAAAELTASRRRREALQLARFRRGRDLRDEIDPAFQQLKDDSLLFTRTLRGFRLQPSTDLRPVPYLAYRLELSRPGLSGVLLAPILDFPTQQGQLGIEMVSPANTIITQMVIPFAEIDVRVPTRFRFAPIADSHQGRFWLRVFVRDMVDPIRLFEWRKYRFGGLGLLQTQAFCGFLFA